MKGPAGPNCTENGEIVLRTSGPTVWIGVRNKEKENTTVLNVPNIL